MRRGQLKRPVRTVQGRRLRGVSRWEVLPGRVVRKGRVLYQRFNGFEPSRTVKVRQPRLIPPVVVQLGDLVGLIYRSDKWQPGRPRTYIHFMQDPPRLVSDSAGRQLYLIGGSYRVTRRGIEG